MSNVSNPSGPLNPTNPPRSTEPVRPGTDRFKDLMRIDRSDEKQKKKKKRSQEAEEEEKAKLQTAGAISADKAIESTKKAEKFPKVQKIDESKKKHPQHQKRPEETTTDPEESVASATSQKKAFEPIETVQSIQKSENKEDITDTTTTAHLQLDLDTILQEEQEIVQKEAAAGNFKQVSDQVDKHKKEETHTSTNLPPPAASTIGPSFLAPISETPPAYAFLSPEAFALFEKMVSVITVLSTSGITETVIHLNTHEFTNSPFSGSQIIIREYSTAPLAYNVELIGNPLAADLFRKNIPLLKNAFAEGKHRFHINRLEASISQEDFPVVERKKGSSGENQDT